MPFRTLGLNEPILSALEAEGYTHPTPIQEQTIPTTLAGKDVLGCAQTGTGKTAAFSLPILQRLIENPLPHKKQASRHQRPIRCLILSPTRELADQIGQSIEAYSRGSDIRHTVIFGGVKQRSQTQALRAGVDIVVATPGRLLDLIGQGHVDLRSVEVFILDEADRMLDMGFVDDIWKILSYIPDKRQSLLFSATMPSKIQSLANRILRDPVDIRIAPTAPAADTITQKLYLVEWANKTSLLKHLIETQDVTRALIFTQTKRRADMLHLELQRAGLGVGVIHSDLRQSVRKRSLENFRSGKKPLLIASDIAARGIDVDDVSHVFNYELPQEAEVYIHRIGRTGRAGADGVAISFCTIDEWLMLDQIETLLGKAIEVVSDHPYPSPIQRTSNLAPKPVEEEKPKASPRSINRHRRPSRRRRL